VANRLQNSGSLYLRQHADQPVDWWPWGPEAHAEAQRRDVPILLSVGYSACHWCHVMAHESFDDPETVAKLNESFVCIKLDREERPDVDDLYMTAVQLTSGRGGWPMTLFLTPSLEPFFAGTYFPKEDRDRYPGFQTIVERVAEAWQHNRPALLETAKQLSEGVEDALSRMPKVVDRSLEYWNSKYVTDRLREDFDETNAGFGTAPKFPPHSALEFFRLTGVPEVQALRTFTLQRMVRGGIFDQVGGGFHRYSTDAEWRLPHFEKMLYDIALLLKELGHETDPELVRARTKTIAWLVSEMQMEDGTFASALDADSPEVEGGHAEEGMFYTWTFDELGALLTAEEVELMQSHFDLRPEGNYDEEATREISGRNLFASPDPLPEQLPAVLDRLAPVRNLRPRPNRDDKRIAAWNGLAISGLVASGEIELAERCAEVWRQNLDCHQLTSAGPEGKPFLDDVAHLGMAFLDLFEATDDSQWHAAARLLVEQLGEFEDTEFGGFWLARNDSLDLFARSKPVFDTPIPSANATAIRLLLRVGQTERAAFHLSRLCDWVHRVPGACEAIATTMLEAQALGVNRYFDVTYKIIENKLRIFMPKGYQLNREAEGKGILIAYEQTARFVNGELPVIIYKNEDELEVALPLGTYKIQLRYQLCTVKECLPWRVLWIDRTNERP
jgi:uncharacterized protein YyaL (SSP411 family)